MSHELKKTALRHETLEKIGQLEADRRHQMSANVRSALSTFDPLSRARTILAFAPLPSEPKIDELLNEWRAAGRRILLPRTLELAGAMELVELGCLMHELPKGPFGIRTPAGEASGNHGIDAVLVPGVAFDREGGRLGRGGGYYDRLLAELEGTMTIGIAFECQLESKLPRDSHDQAVRFIATEKGVFECPAPHGKNTLS